MNHIWCPDFRQVPIHKKNTDSTQKLLVSFSFPVLSLILFLLLSLRRTLLSCGDRYKEFLCFAQWPSIDWDSFSCFEKRREKGKGNHKEWLERRQCNMVHCSAVQFGALQWNGDARFNLHVDESYEMVQARLSSLWLKHPCTVVYIHMIFFLSLDFSFWKLSLSRLILLGKRTKYDPRNPWLKMDEAEPK